MKLEERELINTSGGITISAALLNSFARGINTLLELGRTIGTALNMIVFKKRC